MKPTLPDDSRGRRIRLAIQASNLSQTDVAQRLNISKQSLGDVIHNRIPGDRHLEAIAQLLEVPETWLRDGGPQPDKIGRYFGSLPGVSENVEYFIGQIRDLTIACRRLQLNHPDKYMKLRDKLHPALARMADKGGPPGPIDRPVAEFLHALELFGCGIESAEDRKAFVAGHVELSERRAKHLALRTSAQQNPDRSLPLSEFATIRGALLVLRAERQAFGRSARDANQALNLLWKRQMTFTWVGDTLDELNRQRNSDLGIEANDADGEGEE